MDRGSAAEWLLGRVVDAERASELVGDQIESQPAAGLLRFWLSIVGLVLVFSWRTLLGMLVSPVAGIVLGVVWSAMVRQLVMSHYPQPVSAFISSFVMEQYSLGVSVLLWILTIYSLVRFGFRSDITRMSLGLSLLSNAIPCIYWLPYGKVIVAAGAIVLGLFCLSSIRMRRALGIVSCSVIVMWSTAYGLSKISHDPHSVFGLWEIILAAILIPIEESIIVSYLQTSLLKNSKTTRQVSITNR